MLMATLTLTFRSRHLVHDSNWRGCWRWGFRFPLSPAGWTFSAEPRAFPEESNTRGDSLILDRNRHVAPMKDRLGEANCSGVTRRWFADGRGDSEKCGSVRVM